MRIGEVSRLLVNPGGAIRLIAPVAFLVFCRCGITDAPVAGGFGSETTNGITASARHVDGTPASHVSVRIRRADYVQSETMPKRSFFQARAIAESLFDTTTDDSGSFTVAGAVPGAYVIEINDGDSTAAMARCTLTTQSDTLVLPDLAMRPYATMEGAVDTTDAAGATLRAQIRGLERLALVDSSGHFAFVDLPEGAMDIRIASDGPSSDSAEILNVRTVSSRITPVTVDLADPYVMRLYVNTTPSGAGLAGDVALFPLLVRLDSAGFDFSQATDSGQDVRFTKSDGTSLAREIELWDSASRQAIIWVLVDTIRGNNSDQYVTMVWGNSSALEQSSGATVFDTSNGFMGVWHLSEASTVNGDVGVYKDATAGHHDGSNYSSDIGREGVIGTGKTMDGVDDFIGLTSDVRPTTAYTISAWVNLRDTAGSSMILNDFYWNDTTIFGYFVQLASGSFIIKACDGTMADCQGWAIGVLEPQIWTHLAAVWNVGAFSLYKDGVQLTGSNVYGGSPGSPQAMAYDGTGGTQISNWAHPFNGSVDEVRASGIVRSPDWIKLEYENQKPGSAVVQAGKAR